MLRHGPLFQHRRVPMKTPSRWWRQVRTGISTIPTKVLAGAAGALGTALVAGVPFVYTWTMNAFAGEELVGILSQPDRATTAAAASGPACGAATVQFGQHHQEVELWKSRTSGFNLSATVRSDDGVGHGEVVGYQKVRDGASSVDTISAAFSGKNVG